MKSPHESDQHLTGRGLSAVIFVAAQAFLMLALQVGSTWIANFTLTALGLVAIAPSRFRMGRFLHGSIVGLAAIVFFAFRAREIWQERSMTQLFELFAEYLLFVQCLEFWRPSRDTVTNYLPGLGAIATACIVLTQEAGLTTSALQWIYGVFLLMLLLVLRGDLFLLVAGDRAQRTKLFVLLTIFMTAIASGRLFQQELANDLPEIQKQLSLVDMSVAESQFAANGARFVERVNLSSISEAQRNAKDVPVFTVTSVRPPGYMRTMAMLHFDGWDWSPWKGRLRRGIKTRFPLRGRPDGTSQQDDDLVTGRYYELAENFRPPLFRNVIRVLPGRGKSIPLPHNGSHLYGRVGRFAQRPHGDLIPGTIDTTTYVVYRASNVIATPGAGDLEGYLEIPQSDLKFITSLSESVCSPDGAPREKAAEIKSFFENNFEYSLRSDLQSNHGDRSTIRAFLEDRRAAHCELFATAAVLLLRAQGIPCRLGVGYLVYELNDSGDYYVALNRNAHAWAEAYDRERKQWFIVEATPSISDYIARYADQINASANEIADGGSLATNTSYWESVPSNVVRWWNWVTTNRFTWLIPVALAAILFLRRAITDSRTAAQGSPRVSKLLRKADRLAARAGVRRASSETFHRFADRLVSCDVELRPLAEWYRTYALTRYDPKSTNVVPPPKLVIRKRADVRHSA